MKKEIKEQIDEVIEEDLVKEVDRTSLNIQKFMDDMRLLSEQVRSKNVVKPVFDYGASEVSNYLLWLVLGELMMLNDKLNGEQD